MHPIIEKRLNDLEARRKALVARVAALPKDKQNHKADPKSFSPVEVIMHMALAEQGNVEFMKKAPPSTLKGRRPKVTFIFRKTVSTMENPVKAVATLSSMVPKSQVSLDEAAKTWEDVRNTSRVYFEQVEKPEDPMVKFLFFFGLASASDYLSLLEAHTHYHEQRFPG